MLPIDDSFRPCHDSASSRLMGNSDLHLQSGYSRMASLQPIAECSKRPSMFGIYGQEVGACNPSNHSFCNPCERGGARVAHPTSSGNCYNEQNVKGHVPTDSFQSSRPHIYQVRFSRSVKGTPRFLIPISTRAHCGPSQTFIMTCLS